MSRANRQKIQLVNYVEDYLDSIESMPLDLQRNVSRMREIDAQYQEILKELDGYYEKFNQETDDTQKRRVLRCIQRALIRSQELGDEKIQIANQMVELVENRNTQLDSHVELLEAHQATSSKAGQDKSKSEAQAGRPRKRSRRQRNDDNREDESNDQDHDDTSSGTPKEKKANTSKRRRSKAKADSEESPADLPVDPNEPTYCLCNQVSYGKMIGCDNDECPFEWFHFPCVGLNHKPKGKWYCPNCRGENAKTMDKALEKSKKERAYNR